MLPNQIFIKYRAFSIRCGRTLYQNVKDTPSIRELLRTKLGEYSFFMHKSVNKPDKSKN